MSKALSGLVLFALGQLAGAGMMDQMLIRDSLARVHPRLRSRWFSERGIKPPGYFEPRAPESEGIRMLGKWGRGPSYEVTGRDSLVFLSLGSEEAIINFANPDSPTVLSEPQAMGLVCQAAVWDSFLYLGLNTGAAGIEIWNISDPRNPVFRNRVLTRLTDFCIKDSFAYVTQRSSSPSNDTFKVYNLAHPDNPELVGFCRDSGQAVTVSGNTVILGDWYNLFALDVSDPANPRRVGEYPGFALNVAARGSICCAAVNWNTDDDHFRFEVLDISNPASITRLGYLDNIGGYDIHLDRSLAYVSGYQSGGFEFAIVSIADSIHPLLLGGCVTPGFNDGVWADSDRSLAFVADDWEGLKVIDTRTPSQPVIDTTLLAACTAEDISVTGHLACIAEYMAGLKLLDVSNPTSPVELSALDTAGQSPFSEAVAASDSFAFVEWSRPTFRSVSIGDPLRPSFVGGCLVGNPADIVLRDTFAYTAGVRRFQVINVARPREPVLVGSCTLPDESGGMSLQDTLAFVPNAPTQVVNIADPAHPTVVAQIDRDAWNVFVQDTLAFFAGGNGLFIYSVANINSPYLIDSSAWSSNVFDVVVSDSLAYVSCEDGVRLLSVADPSNPILLGFLSTPYGAWRVGYAAPHLYVACQEAGVCILETLPVGIAEPAWPGAPPSSSDTYLRPSLVRGFAWVSQRQGGPATPVVYDHAGREQVLPPGCQTREGRWTRLDMRGLPTGVYFVRFPGDAATEVMKIVKL